MIDKSVVEWLINDAKEDIITLNKEVPIPQSLIDEITIQLHTLESLLSKFPYIYPELQGTLGHHVRNTIIETRCIRLQKLFDIRAPFCILFNEAQALNRCLSEKPVQNWLKYKDRQLISFEERKGRKGKLYMLIYTPEGVVYLFQGRFGPWLTTDADMDAKKLKRSKKIAKDN